MRTSLTLTHDYSVGPDRLFDLVTDLDTLDAVTKPWVQIHHLPSGPVHGGQVIDVALSVLGILPARPYKIRILCCDAAARQMQSEETGLGVRLLHRVEVLPVAAGARLIDRIDIDAGWRTPLVAAFVRASYRWRHRKRLGLLRDG